MVYTLNIYNRNILKVKKLLCHKNIKCLLFQVYSEIVRKAILFLFCFLLRYASQSVKSQDLKDFGCTVNKSFLRVMLPNRLVYYSPHLALCLCSEELLFNIIRMSKGMIYSIKYTSAPGFREMFTF